MVGDLTVRRIAREFTGLTYDRPGPFDEMAAAVFSFQQARNPVYSRYCKAMGGVDAGFSIGSQRIPFLPVQAFKHAPVVTFPADEADLVFESSGTGRGTPSKHYVRDRRVYERAVSAHFSAVFGEEPVVVASHLPHYVDRGRSSSLLYMVEHLTEQFGAEGSGSFLGDVQALEQSVRVGRTLDLPLIVFGAAFGLLEFVDEHEPVRLPDSTLVIETGGMKTYRRAVDRDELHTRLADGFGLDRSRIWSEYGMCELMSQCYTRGGEIFYPPPWMRVAVVDSENPTVELDEGEPGALAVFDLANIHSVSAILTEDRAVLRDGGFEVLGRLSGAELRGCNFLLERV